MFNTIDAKSCNVVIVYGLLVKHSLLLHIKDQSKILTENRDHIVKALC